MLSAALLELFPDPDAVINRLNSLGIPEVVFEKEPVFKCGILGTHMKVTVRGEEATVMTMGVITTITAAGMSTETWRISAALLPASIFLTKSVRTLWRFIA